MRKTGFLMILLAVAGMSIGSCRTYMYRAICYSSGTKIYEGHVDIDKPPTLPALFGMDVFPDSSWLRTADGAYIRGDCVVQPMRIDGKDDSDAKSP
ncbi:MAG: hypothetical protein KDK37_03065 [Leptospiraceae bacterium]|nr:hypothetical protein [Leptospiraceae bacterium]